MSTNRPRTAIRTDSGFLRDLVNRVKLILRLMGDRRVSPWLKLLPVGALLYVVWPIDIPGPFDDAAVLWLGTSLFVELCPAQVVQEHLEGIRRAPQVSWETSPAGEVVDAQFRETGPGSSRQV